MLTATDFPLPHPGYGCWAGPCPREQAHKTTAYLVTGSLLRENCSRKNSLLPQLEMRFSSRQSRH